MQIILTSDQPRVLTYACNGVALWDLSKDILETVQAINELVALGLLTEVRGEYSLPSQGRKLLQDSGDIVP